MSQNNRLHFKQIENYFQNSKKKKKITIWKKFLNPSINITFFIREKDMLPISVSYYFFYEMLIF